MTRKVITLLVVAGIVVIAITERPWFTELIKSGGNYAIAISILFTAICAFVPGIPFVVTTAIIGSTYGTWAGTGITLTGSMLAYMLMFVMARFGFSAWARKIIEKYPKARQYESHFEKRTFVTVLVARLIPVIPSTLINVLSGVSKVSWVSFFVASLLAKLPVDILYTFAGKELTINRWMSFLIYGIYLLVVVTGTYIYASRERKATL